MFRDLERLRPDNARHLGCLGTRSRQRGCPRRRRDARAAVAAGREAIRLKPDDAEAHTNLGNVLSSQGKLDEAIAEYREAIRLKPDDAEAHYNLGIALQRPGQARRGDRRVPRGDPAQARRRRRPTTNLGIALNDQGKLDEADRRIPRGDPAQARLRRGPLQPRQRPDRCRASSTRPSPVPQPQGAAPGDASWLEQLAEALEARGLLREADDTFAAAVAASREAIRLKPETTTAHINLGHALQSQGKLDEAIAEYPRGAETRPEACPDIMDMDRAIRHLAQGRSGSSPTTPRPTTSSATT